MCAQAGGEEGEVRGQREARVGVVSVVVTPRSASALEVRVRVSTSVPRLGELPTFRVRSCFVSSCLFYPLVVKLVGT